MRYDKEKRAIVIAAPELVRLARVRRRTRPLSDDAPADAAVEELPLHVDTGGGEGAEKSGVQIAPHGRVDGEYALLLVPAELRLREHDVVGGGLALRLCAHRAPVRWRSRCA